MIDKIVNYDGGTLSRIEHEETVPGLTLHCFVESPKIPVVARDMLLFSAPSDATQDEIVSYVQSAGYSVIS